MCALAMREPRLRHVPDSALEPAFAGNPWVDGRLGSVRLYATAPMRLLDGRVLGTLCVFAEEPGSLSPDQLDALEDLAAQAVALFEQGRLARELEAARDQALAATRAKTAFLAAASHEIRTPLNGVLGMLEALGLEQLSPRQAEFVSLARSSGESLLVLLNDVLDLSKAETTAVTLAERPFRPADVAAEVVTALLPVARRRGLDLAVQGSDDGVLVGDPVRLRQVVMNLVGNALKFTERGQVHVAVRIDRDPAAPAARLRLSVSDTGAGMEADEIQRLFRPFVQGAQGARFGGTGLGLALSQQLVGLMGGRIDVVSRPGTGSLFTVVVDLPGADGDAPATVPVTQPAPAGWTLPEPRKAPRRVVRVLVADDSEVNLRVAEALLQAEGAEVVTVEDGDDAVRAVAGSTSTWSCSTCRCPACRVRTPRAPSGPWTARVPARGCSPSPRPPPRRTATPASRRACRACCSSRCAGPSCGRSSTTSRPPERCASAAPEVEAVASGPEARRLHDVDGEVELLPDRRRVVGVAAEAHRLPALVVEPPDLVGGGQRAAGVDLQCPAGGG